MYCLCQIWPCLIAPDFCDSVWLIFIRKMKYASTPCTDFVEYDNTYYSTTCTFSLTNSWKVLFLNLTLQNACKIDNFPITILFIVELFCDALISLNDFPTGYLQNQKNLECASFCPSMYTWCICAHIIQSHSLLSFCTVGLKKYSFFMLASWAGMILCSR